MEDDPVLALFARWRDDIDAEPMPPLPFDPADVVLCAQPERVRCQQTVRSLRLLLRSARSGRGCR